MKKCFWHNLSVSPHFGCPKCDEELIKQGLDPEFSHIVDENWIEDAEQLFSEEDYKCLI